MRDGDELLSNCTIFVSLGQDSVYPLRRRYIITLDGDDQRKIETSS